MNRRISIVADHDVPERICAYLRSYGHRVVELNDRRGDDRTLGFDDADILSCAANARQAVLTCNYRDFIGLHVRGALHYGIIECPVRTDPRETAQAINQALQTALQENPQLVRTCVSVRLP